MTTKKAVALYVVCRGLPIHGTLSIQVQASCWNFLHIISLQKKKKNIPWHPGQLLKVPPQKKSGPIFDIPYKNNTK